MTDLDTAALRALHQLYLDAFNSDVPREKWLTDVGEAAVGVVEHVPALLDRVEAQGREIERLRGAAKSAMISLDGGRADVWGIVSAARKLDEALRPVVLPAPAGER